MIALQITVKGKVQGVSYRYYCSLSANQLGLSGFVQNINNGSVYIECQGEKFKVNQFIDWCRMGSPAADVTSLQINPIPTFPNNLEFHIKR